MTPDTFPHDDAFRPGQPQDQSTDAPPADPEVYEFGDPEPAEPARDETDKDVPPHEGKKIFRPHELNQAGEDKEYFPPDKDHRFAVPKDANSHALKPDVEVAPGNTVISLPDRSHDPVPDRP